MNVLEWFCLRQCAFMNRLLDKKNSFCHCTTTFVCLSSWPSDRVRIVPLGNSHQVTLSNANAAWHRRYVTIKALPLHNGSPEGRLTIITRSSRTTCEVVPQTWQHRCELIWYSSIHLFLWRSNISDRASFDSVCSLLKTYGRHIKQ